MRRARFKLITALSIPRGGTSSIEAKENNRYLELWPQSPDGAKRVLVVEARMLTPDRDSGSHRMWEILKILQRLGNSVTFTTTSLEYREPYVQALRALGIQVVTSQEADSIQEYIKHVARGFDVIVLSRVIVALGLIDWVRTNAPQAKIIFDTVDLHFLREKREAQVKKAQGLRERAQERQREELDTALKADLTLVVSPVEKEVLSQINPALRVEVLSNIHVPRNARRPFSERKGLLFVGGFEHEPNIDAVLFYVREIHPLLQKALPGVKTYIVGSEPPPSVQRLATENIIVTGYVKDLSPYFENCRVFIAPLRYGAGVKGKVNMAMSYGLPVVGTPVALEGIHATYGEEALVADEPQAFAENVLSLYQDEVLWTKVAQNGMENVQKYFSPQVAEQTLKKILQ